MGIQILKFPLKWTMLTVINNQCALRATQVSLFSSIEIFILTFVLVHAPQWRSHRSGPTLSIIHPQASPSSPPLTTQQRAQRCATKPPKAESPSCSPEAIRRGANTRPFAAPKTSRGCYQASERLVSSSGPTSLSKHFTTKSPPPTPKSQPPQPSPPTRESCRRPGRCKALVLISTISLLTFLTMASLLI